MKNQKYIIEVSEKYADYMDHISPDFQEIAKELSGKLLALSDELIEVYGEFGVDDNVVINLSALKESRFLFDALACCSVSKYEGKDVKACPLEFDEWGVAETPVGSYTIAPYEGEGPFRCINDGVLVGGGETFNEAVDLCNKLYQELIEDCLQSETESNE